MDALLVSVHDASLMLGIGRSKTWQLINEGHLETVAIGRRRLVTAESVRALASNGSSRAVA